MFQRFTVDMDKDSLGGVEESCRRCVTQRVEVRGAGGARPGHIPHVFAERKPHRTALHRRRPLACFAHALYTNKRNQRV